MIRKLNSLKIREDNKVHTIFRRLNCSFHYLIFLFSSPLSFLPGNTLMLISTLLFTEPTWVVARLPRSFSLRILRRKLWWNPIARISVPGFRAFHWIKSYKLRDKNVSRYFFVLFTWEREKKPHNSRFFICVLWEAAFFLVG